MPRCLMHRPVAFGLELLLLRCLLLLCRAADWLAEQPSIEIGTRCNLFEANIRVMGGLIR